LKTLCRKEREDTGSGNAKERENSAGKLSPLVRTALSKLSDRKKNKKRGREERIDSRRSRGKQGEEAPHGRRRQSGLLMPPKPAEARKRGKGSNQGVVWVNVS